MITVIQIFVEESAEGLGDSLDGWTIVQIINKALDLLTLQEQAQLLLVVELGENPKRFNFYNATRHLFTRANGKRMHPQTRAALRGLILSKLDITEAYKI